jgi:hypothetical protein
MKTILFTVLTDASARTAAAIEALAPASVYDAPWDAII